MLGLLKLNPEKNREKTRDGVRRSRETWFGRILGVLRSPQLDDGVWEDLEEILISADIGVETSFNLIERLKLRARDERLSQPQQILEALKSELVTCLQGDGKAEPWLEAETEASPLVILVVGVNGAGKTTSIAKLAFHFREAGKKVLLAAADTFRAAAIEQLQILGQRAGGGSGKPPAGGRSRGRGIRRFPGK